MVGQEHLLIKRGLEIGPDVIIHLMQIIWIMARKGLGFVIDGMSF
jgi:hypothetical protein